MSSPLIAYAAPSVNRTVVSWLVAHFGAGGAGLERPQRAQLPYRMVTTVIGTETVERTRRCATVSVHTFDKSMDYAEYQSELTHQRMLALGPPQVQNQTVTVTLPDMSTREVTPDFIVCTQIPIWVDYEDDQIFRFVARYEIGLRFVANT